MHPLAAVPLLVARLLYSGWVDGRVETCWCDGRDQGGLPAKAAFLEDVGAVEPVGLMLDLGQWLRPGDEERGDPAAMLRGLADMGFDALALGLWEASRDPDEVEGWLREQPLTAVLTGVADPGGLVADHLLIPWEGEVLLLMAVVDPLDADPLWGLPEPEDAVARAMASADGLFDRALLVSWLDTFRNRDIAASWPGRIDIVVEGLYEFEGVETPGHAFGLVGLDRCARLQVLVRDDPAPLDPAIPVRWARRRIDIGDEYAGTPPDLTLWPAPAGRPEPPVSSRVCRACHEVADDHGHPPAAAEAGGRCRACHAGGWGHVMAAASEVPMPPRPVACASCHGEPG